MTQQYNDGLPGINYGAPISLDDYEFLEGTISGELLQRLRLVFGASTSVARYGIVSGTNPALETNGELMPSQDLTTPSIYNISPGIAVTRLGQVAVITTPQQVTVTSDSVGAVFVIVLDYQTVDDSPRLSEGLNYVPARRVRIADSSMISLVSLATYNLYNSTQLQSKVVLGVVTITQNADGSITSALSTRKSVVSENRPWFSPVDIEHRSKVGSGVVSAANPHGNALEDFDTGAVALFEQLSSDGRIVAKDYQYPFTPGTKQTMTVSSGDIRTSDNSFAISRLPVVLGTLLGAPDDSGVRIEYPYSMMVEGDALRIKLGITPLLSSLPLTFTYQAVDALEPSINAGKSALTFRAPSAWETIISEGRVVRGVASQEVQAADLGTITQPFDVFCLADGSVVRSPYVLLREGRLGSDYSLGTQVTVANQPVRNFIVRPVLADPSSLVDVSIVINGNDPYGNPYSAPETMEHVSNNVLPPNSLRTYDGTPLPDTGLGIPTVVDFGLPPEFARLNGLLTEASGYGPVHVSSRVYSKITSIQVNASTSYRPSSQTTFTLLAYIDPRTLAYAGHATYYTGIPSVAGLSLKITKFLPDLRRISPALEETSLSLSQYADFMQPLYDGITRDGRNPVGTLFFIEDFTRPRKANLEKSSLLTLRTPSKNKIYYCSRAIDLSGLPDWPAAFSGYLYYNAPGGRMDGKLRITGVTYSQSNAAITQNVIATVNLRTSSVGSVPITSTGQNQLLGLIVEVSGSHVYGLALLAARPV